MNLQPDIPEKSIAYEIFMFRFCFEKLKHGVFLSDREGDVFLEGFLLHFRNLHYFFTGSGWKTDLFVADFKKQDGSSFELKETDDEEEKLIEKVDRHLLHITKYRIQEKKKDWGESFDFIVSKTEERIEFFLDEIGEDSLDKIKLWLRHFEPGGTGYTNDTGSQHLTSYPGHTGRGAPLSLENQEKD